MMKQIKAGYIMKYEQIKEGLVYGDLEKSRFYT